MNELPVVLYNKPGPVLHSNVFTAINFPKFNSLQELALLISELPLAVTSLRGKNGRIVHSKQHLQPVPQSSDAIKRVLIVDGNDSDRMILKQMLLLKQIEPDEAQNGFEALNLLARGAQYDVIFVDYHMPFMDGLKTIRKIRKHFSDPSHPQKIILLYSSPDDELMINASEELSIISRLVKPVKMQEMYTQLFQSFEKDSSQQMQPVDTVKEKLRAQPLTVLITEDNSANLYFDLQQVINYIDGDTAFLAEFLDITRKELEASLADLQAAARASNLSSLNASAHKLKGTALITGMDKLSNLAKMLEELTEFHESMVNDLLNNVREETAIVITHIEAFKTSL